MIFFQKIEEIKYKPRWTEKLISNKLNIFLLFGLIFCTDILSKKSWCSRLITAFISCKRLNFDLVSGTVFLYNFLRGEVSTRSHYPTWSLSPHLKDVEVTDVTLHTWPYWGTLVETPSSSKKVMKEIESLLEI